MKKFFVPTLTLVLVLLSAGLALAQTAQPPSQPSDDQVNAVARQLYCPVCENIPLDVCPTQACAEWRELIRQKLAQGWSETRIKQYFVQQYGDRVLGTPPARGLNLLVYIVPPVLILAGVFVLFRALQAWKKPLPEKPPASLNTDDEYVRRLEEELRQR